MNDRYYVFDLPGFPNIVVGLYRFGEVYVVCFPHDDDTARVNTMRLLGRWASNPFLDFDWRDATKVITRIKYVRARIRSGQES